MELHTKMELKQKKSFSLPLAHPKSLNKFYRSGNETKNEVRKKEKSGKITERA